MRESLPLRRQWLPTQLLSTCSQGSSLHELARELDYSEKTIRRDLETLRSAGFPIEETTEAYGRKHWRLNGGPNKPPQITFSLEEISALYLGRRFLEPLAGTLFWKGTEDAFRKVRALLGDNSLRHLEKMAAAWHQTTFGKSDYARQAELIDELMIAIEDEKVTLITYQSASATEPVTREVYPYGLVSHRHALNHGVGAEALDPAFEFFQGSQAELGGKAAVAVLGQTLAGMPFVLFDVAGDGRREPDAGGLLGPSSHRCRRRFRGIGPGRSLWA